MEGYVRKQPLDMLTVGGESLLLLPPDQVLRLSEIATTLFELSSSWRSLDDLAASVESTFGPSPDGNTTDALRRILDGLVEAGAMERVNGG
ncbi:hypothetical protein [Aestuariimicrobium sp. Y1814]|uniref:hypothetical protein n=1 Tax=Aestuariimicrobium sp. Y1814 TaxID=3418742 RepID=UPI003DA769BC